MCTSSVSFNLLFRQDPNNMDNLSMEKSNEQKEGNLIQRVEEFVVFLSYVFSLDRVERIE